MTPIMANQRGKSIKRISLTLPDDLLARIESEVERSGGDRLALIREAVKDYLDQKARPAKADPSKKSE